MRAQVKRKIADLSVLALFSLLTGAAAGVVVTLYTVLAHYGESCSVSLYAEIFARPYFIPLLLAALLLAAIAIGTAVRFVPMARGSGVPQAEGAARGLFRLKWYSALCTMFAASLAAVFLGLGAGTEGPSVLMGGCFGECAADLSEADKRNRGALVAAGAGAGLAVAFNAPLTGVLFAAEEAKKKIDPSVVVSALIAVVSALVVRGGLRKLISLADPEIAPFAPTFSAYDLTAADTFAEIFAMLGAALAVAVLAAALGAAFYASVFALKKLLGKLTFFKGAGRMTVPFLLAGALGMISLLVMGGGHSLVQAVGTSGGTQEMSAALNFASPLAVALAVLLVMKFAATACNIGAGVPCGAFVPMLAIGACAGALAAQAAAAAGMPAAYSDTVVMLFVAAFFSAVVKAPVTSAVMIFELTGSYNFALLLPTAAAVATAYLLSSLMRVRPLYDALLVGYVFPGGKARLR